MDSTHPSRPRIQVLLDLKGRPGAVERAPSPSAKELSAESALSYGWPPSSAHARVYEFDSYREASAAQKALLQAADRTRLSIETTVNGSLLLWATARSDDAAGQAHLEGLAGHFAGEE